MHPSLTAALIALTPLALAAQAVGSVSVTLSRTRAEAPLDGRLLLLFSADTAGEPRFQSSWGLNGGLTFGVDVDGWRPGDVRAANGDGMGFPIKALKDVPAGRYRVQVLLNRYETFRRSDGHTVKLPPDMGEGQQWRSKPGNLFSAVRAINFDPKAGGVLRLSLDSVIPPIADYLAKETKYVKYVKIRSEKLSKFWGRDVTLAAWVLLPWGFDEHPGARYPMLLNHGHFPSSVGSWRETPPDPTLKPDYSERFSLAGYNRIQEEESYRFFQEWTGKGFPRALMVEVQHPTPYYDDSYAVNSANNGPYGDAIMKELVPYIEQKYRGIGQGYARITFGGSTR